MPTVVTKIVKYSGGDYTSIQAALDATPSNLVTADEQWDILIDESAAGVLEWSGATKISVPARTTDATRYIRIRPNTGKAFSDHASKTTNALRYNASNGAAIKCTGDIALEINASYTRVEDLQVYSTAAGAIACPATNSTVRDCIVRSDLNTYISWQSVTYVNGAGTSLINSLFYSDAGTDGMPNGVSVEASSVVIANCTIFGRLGGERGIRVPNNDDPVVRNTAVFGYASVFNDTANVSASSSNIATNLSSVGVGSSHQTSLTASDQFESLTAGSYDFRSKTTGALDLNGARDQTYTADLDIVGQARSTSTPNIGAWENAAALPPTAPSGVTAGSITPTSASISWTDNSSDETGFKVQTAPDPFTSWTAASGSPAAANATSLSVTGLSPGTTYKARVAATNANGDSAWVESSTFTTTSALAGRALLLGVG